MDNDLFQKVIGPCDVDGRLAMDKGLSGRKGGCGGGGLHLEEGAHEGAVLRGTVVIGVEGITAEGIFLLAPLGIHITLPGSGQVRFQDGEKALAGHGYFDKYLQNDGVYYTKVIKVQ